MEAKENSQSKSWNLASGTYDDQVGAMTRHASVKLVSLMSDLSPLTPISRVLDVGAGTGQLTHALASASPASATVLATDISPGMITQLLKSFEDLSTERQKVMTRILDAANIAEELQGQTFTHVTSSFMLQFCSTPEAILRSMYDVTAPGGVCAVAIWGSQNDPLNIYSRACSELDPAWITPHSHDKSAWWSMEELIEGMRKAGFVALNDHTVMLDFAFDTADRFVDFWFNGSNPASKAVVNAWKGSMTLLKDRVKNIVKDEYSNGKELHIEALMLIGARNNYE